MLAAADTAELEPEGLSPAGYVEYALDQCQRRGIDVFVPRLHQAAIVAHRADFAAIGTALLAPPPEAVAVFHDKVIAYEAVQAVGVPVPPWWRVRTADELVAAVEELEADGHKACFKPASGAGGVGFRVITRAPFSLAQLNGFPGPYVPLDTGRRGAAAGRGAGGLAGHAASRAAGGVGGHASPGRTTGCGWRSAARRTAGVAGSPSTSSGWSLRG